MLSYEAILPIIDQVQESDLPRLLRYLERKINPKKKDKTIDPEIQKILTRIQTNNAKKR